ncbi:MAG: phosphatidate cytidylyltransferase [Paludibacteraceae bacterium]|nr:phosphatidate cytidylyltransferase [Paludibacteraceae bacterium]
MSNLVQRTVFGAVYVCAVVASILWHPLCFGILFAGTGMISVREFNLLMRTSKAGTVISMLAAGVLFLICWMPIGLADRNFGHIMAISVAVYLLLFATAILAELWTKAENPVLNWGNFLQSQMMIALPFALMNLLYNFSPYVLLAVFVLIWVNDSGAYCVGSLTAKLPKGNHKMFPRVSPKKSWEGLFGGVLFTLATAVLLAYFGWFEAIRLSISQYTIGLCFGLVVSVFGTLGDLVESLFKRTVGVKDSGVFLPGHGGALDRFDSILLAVPATIILLIVLDLFR